MTAMRAAFIAQGKDGILKARAVEDQLMRETWQTADYDLLPRLRSLGIPTLVIAGEDDFIPPDVARHLAAAIPGARMQVVEKCGHFAYLECPGDVRRAVNELLKGPSR
jgi:proline iminopeptidase